MSAQHSKCNVPIVLAIHGTFAPDAKWAQPSSNLHKFLEKELNSGSINWVSFSWSGGNSHSAREFAATELAHTVAKLSLQHPEAEIHLIGHSHGGNVALMMLSANIDLRPKVASVTCLSTPFLKFKVGGQEQHSDEIALISIQQIIFGFAMTVLVTNFADLGSALIFAYIFMATWAYLFSTMLGKDLASTDLRRVQRYYNYQRIKTPVLAVRVSRDEALLWLRIVHLMAEVPRRLRHITIGLTFILSLGLVLLPISLILWAFFPAVRYLLLLGILMLGWQPVLLIVLSNARAFVRMGPWALGESGPFGYFSKFQVEHWPSRVQTCRKVVLTIPFLIKTLRHSAAYELPTCGSEVATHLAALKK